MDNTAMETGMRYTRMRKFRTRTAWLFLLPMLAVLTAVAGWPLIRTIWFGFTDAQLSDLAAAKFVGPSGCGKSTLLRLIAGLEEITDGILKIDGKIVNDTSPADRGLAMVFQSYALYPHMTAYENMAFGLKQGKFDRSKIDENVREAATDLLFYLTSAEGQKMFNLLGTYTPSVVSLFSDPEIQKKNPVAILEVFNNAVPRPAGSTGSKYNRVSSEFYNAVHSALSGKSTAEDALKSLESSLKRMGRGGWK